MDAPDRHNGQRDKRTDGRTDGRRDASLCLSVRPFVRSSLRWSLTLKPHRTSVFNPKMLSISNTIVGSATFRVHTANQKKFRMKPRNICLRWYMPRLTTNPIPCTPTICQSLRPQLLKYFSPPRSGCSANQNVKRTDLAVFQCRGPTSWNSLPQTFRDATLILGHFQRRLKTSLYRSGYVGQIWLRSRDCL